MPKLSKWLKHTKTHHTANAAPASASASSLCRNKIAHALFGDTVKGKPSWYQQHALKQNYSIKCGALNVGGLQKASKRMQIEDQSPDLLALCATHLQAHLEHSESQQFDDHRF